ncbi:hypothetical protein F5Y06DRAFT_255819 [Hypoxylon sp. FL0890]|nr:hypothetical protein F5Y06DRAFT_255819 [Hypoxylon sp. FL0890]
MYSKAIIVAALTASASAHMAALLPRQTENADADLASPTESTTPECESRIQSWSAAFPTPPPQLTDALNDNPDGGMAAEGVDGMCSFAAGLDKNEAAAFTSFNHKMYSYLSGQSSNLVAIATSCSADMGAAPSVITSQLDELLEVYSSFSADGCKDVSVTLTSSTTKSSGSSGFITSASPTLTSSGSGSSSTGLATGSATTSASDSANASGASSSTSSSTAASTVSQNAGPRETGMFAAAAMAMGVLGAAMAL